MLQFFSPTSRLGKREPQFSGNAMTSNRPDAGYINQDLHLILERERARSDRSGRPFSQIMIKCKVDDKVALHHILRTINNRVRSIDMVCWFEKQSFAIVLPETSADNAWTLAENLMTLIGAARAYVIYTVYTYLSEKSSPANAY